MCFKQFSLIAAVAKCKAGVRVTWKGHFSSLQKPIYLGLGAELRVVDLVSQLVGSRKANQRAKPREGYCSPPKLDTTGCLLPQFVATAHPYLSAWATKGMPMIILIS